MEKNSGHSKNGRAFHGKNGKGRFKAFALGSNAEWNTTFQNDGKKFNYLITGNANNLIDFNTTDPIEKQQNFSDGTEVKIYNLKKSFSSLTSDSIHLDLAKLFAAYLTEYPYLKLEYDGQIIDPKSAQFRCDDYNLGDVEITNGKSITLAVSVIEWKMQTARVFHLCDSKGISLFEYPLKKQIRAPGFNFTAYIKSEHFLELDKNNELGAGELHPEVSDILKVARNKVKEHFRRRTHENQSEIVEQWKKDQIYPYEDKIELNPVEIAERQVFDILAVNVQSYLPEFDDKDKKSKKFTFRLLAQAISDNPESVQKIISEVLGLKKEEQDDLADLLERTQLSSIISSAKIVANRLDFLVGLENLLFDKDTKRTLLERDQLHKILENEAWLFHEEFSLAGSEQRLEEVLNFHPNKLGKREDNLDPVELSDGRTGRIDLMFHKAIQPHDGKYEYLIIELKRPKKKIDDEVLTQIKKYAHAVAEDERFKDVPIRWIFLAISNDLDKYARNEASQRDRPKGMVYNHDELNITIWAKTWAEIINDAKIRLKFINQQLEYEANRESSKAYLQKTHSKFIPDSYQE